jgi:alpha-beta hydrolase superfamily lysophospholipase
MVRLALIPWMVIAAFSSAWAQMAPRSDGAATPFTAYGPASCTRTMIVSHGLGGTAGGNAGFASAMASRGWRVYVMGHAESGPSLIRQAIASGQVRERLTGFASDPARHRARMADLAAVLQIATAGCRPPRLVLAGHSMGATTTMLEAGAVSRAGRFGADRFDAYVALSPQGIGYMWDAGAWQGVRKPVLMITGTADRSPDGGYESRLTAFEGLPPGRKRLAILPGANHFALAGNDSRIGGAMAEIAADFLDGRPPRPARGIRFQDK